VLLTEVPQQDLLMEDHDYPPSSCWFLVKHILDLDRMLYHALHDQQRGSIIYLKSQVVLVVILLLEPLQLEHQLVRHLELL
jgi:hypothetical protein